MVTKQCCWVVLLLNLSICTFFDGVASQTIRLRLKTGDGNEVTNRSVLESSTITFECWYENIAQTGLISIDLLAGTDRNNLLTVTNCLIKNDGTEPEIGYNDVNPPVPKSNVTNSDCTSNTFFSQMGVAVWYPKYWACQYVKIVGGSKSLSEVVTIGTYTTPSMGGIEQTIPGSGNIVTEGSIMAYKCEATARPPPVLRFKLDSGVVITEGVTHSPPPASINDNTPSGTSMLIWSANATKAYNGEKLICEIIQHLDENNRPTRTTQLAVYYGPYDKAEKTVDYNLQESDSKAVECEFDSNPNPLSSYEWYNGSISASNKLSTTSKSYTINKSSYSHIKQDGTNEVLTLFCQARNDQNNNKKASQKFNIKIFNAQITTTTTTEQTMATEVLTTKKPSTGETGVSTAEWTWEIALIVLAGLILIAFIVVLIVCLIKRRPSSPAQKKKAAAKNNTLPSNNTSSYQSSNIGQPDRISNNQHNYTPQPNPDYRLSTPNVEDYADAFDHKPRSRRPIALEDMSGLDTYPSAPALEQGPPAYTDTMYSGYGTPQGSYNSAGYRGYGAPC